LDHTWTIRLQIAANHGESFTYESQKLVESMGCRILFLPPYSPDLNPIEKYWANMKDKIRNLLPSETIFTNAMDKAIL